MKKQYLLFVIIFSLTFIHMTLPRESLAYWIWTPEVGKWINPKYAVKPTPKEQYDWALEVYEEKDFSKAADEFERLVINYPTSKYAPSSLYYRGLCLEELNYHYEAYRSYDRAMREYPTFENIEEIVEREFKIGELFLAGQKRKVMGMQIFPSLGHALEIFSSIAENAPFSKYGGKAQFNVGVVLKKFKKYTEAKEAFEKVVLNYPDSEIAERAKFEAAKCLYLISGTSDYEQTTTREAINELSEFLEEKPQDEELSREAEGQLSILQDKDAEHLYNIAKFYEKTKKYESALIYYKEILDKYAQSSYAEAAKEKIKILEETKK